MSKSLAASTIFILASILFTTRVAATPPRPDISQLENIEPSKIYFNNYETSNHFTAEVTPWNLSYSNPGGWKVYFISTYNTTLCTTPSNIFALSYTENIVDRGTCRTLTSPLLDSSTYNIAPTLPLWRRDYYGVFSAHLINKNSTPTIYTINHGEAGSNNSNMGEKIPGCAPLPDMGYGELSCDPNLWWGSYNAFVSLSSFPFDTNNLSNPTLQHFGPIAWPANGYIESLNGGTSYVKATDGGIRQPTGFVDNNYLYVYYEDLSQGDPALGRGPGLKVIRAPITSQGVDPSTFKTYYNRAWTDSALPPGFELDRYYNSFSVKGGRSSDILNSTLRMVGPTPGSGRSYQRKIADVISFSVAKVHNTPYYIGVGFDMSVGATLRLSTDLVNWSAPTLIPGSNYDFWSGSDIQKTPLLYPRLARISGDSNEVIDANDFYVIGTQTRSVPGTFDQKMVVATRLKLNLPETSIPGDLNNDGRVEILDFNLLITKFGNPYTILDFNTIISNFGK